jgi:hypothetical protein
VTTGRIGFRDRHLGPWSSHPAFLRRRSRIWAMLGFLPLLVGVVVVLGAWRFGTVSLLSLVRQWNTWLPLALALLAFGFAAAVTVLLIARASTVPALQAAGRGRGRLGFGIAFAALLAALAYAFTRADLLRSALSPQSIAGLRLVGHLLGTLPVFLLIAGLELGGAAVDQWGEPAVGRTRWQKIRRGIALGAMLLAYLLPMLWLDRIVNALDLFAAHQRDPVAHPANSVVSDWQRWIPGFDHDPASTPAGGTLPDLLTAAHDALAAIAVLLPLVGLTGFVLFSASSLLAVGKAGREPVDADEVAKAEGYDLRPTGESWDANDGRSPRPVASRWRATDAEREAEAPAVVVAEPPEWLAQVREVLATQQPCEWGEVRRADGVEASPTSDRRDLAHLFATAFDAASGQSEPPTKDQVAALEEFDRLFEAFLIAEDREGTCVFPSTDLLVTGAPGSGRTTLLLAVALHAVVLRGQSVLLLAPSVEKAALYVRRLRDLAARGGVGWHVAVGQILPDDVRSWADGVDARQPAAEAAGAHRSPVGSLPDILVGTPHDYERCLYGADHHHAAVRRALLRLQVVLLEDVATFSVAERRHLPFLIEKHRLVLASEHLPTQFLALAPDLTAEAASYLTERLFSERAKVPVRRLRPAARPAPWVLDLAAASPSATAEALAAACAAADLRVVLWRPGAGKEDRERLAATLGEKAARVQVVADLDELPADDGVTADIAVYRSLTAQQHTLALSSHVAGVDTVLVRVTRPGVLVPAPETDKTLPVLPSVESEALFVAHLQSAARFFAPFTPAPRDLFARIGLRTAGQLLGLPRRAADFEALPGVSLRLDPPERHAEPVPASRGRSWAWVALDVDGYSDRRQPPPPRPVEMLRPLPRGSEVRRDVGDDRVVLGKAAVDERALAAWVTQQNESLDRMDLACADDLMHRHGDQAFVPRHIESAEDGLRIRGEPFRDKDQGERYLPLFDAAVTVPPKARAEGDQGGVAPRVLRWFHVREAARADARVQAQFWLTGAFDATGGCHRLSPPAPLHYAIRLGALLLGPEQAAAGTLQADRDERTHRAFAGVWDTRRRSHAAGGGALRPRPWPALGLALTAGLREALPGLFDYCRLAAHRGPADGVNDARAFVLFFEPLATRDTVGSAMRKLLMDADLTVAVLAAARRRLAAVDPRDFDTLANLLVEGRALVGDGWYDEHADGEQALAADVTDAMALLDGTMAEVRAKAQRGDRLREKRRAAEGDAE